VTRRQNKNPAFTLTAISQVQKVLCEFNAPTMCGNQESSTRFAILLEMSVGS